MPLLKLCTSIDVPKETQQALLAEMSTILATAIGKPEQYCMAVLDHGEIIMAGKAGPAAFADVRSIGGLNGKVNREVSKRLCALLKDRLGISPERVYINFTDVAASNWGWNGQTFG